MSYLYMILDREAFSLILRKQGIWDRELLVPDVSVVIGLTQVSLISCSPGSTAAESFSTAFPHG